MTTPISPSSNLSPWPQHRNIPIYLDTQNGNKTPRIYRSTDRTSPSPEDTQSRRSPRFLRIASPIPPPNFSHKVPNPKATQQSPKVPFCRPPLRYFLDKKMPRTPGTKQLGPRRTSSTIQDHNSIRQEIQFSVISSPNIRITPPNTVPRPASNFGLGIVHGLPRHAATISSKGISLNEKDDSAPHNFAQTFEKRIWEFNESDNVIKRWLLELISWFLSAICMAAIVIVLLILKDEKLPRWPLGLTLNAYIAVLSKVAGAALLLPVSEALGQLKWSWFQGDSKKMWDFEIFDNASRGPWGSIMLLIRTKGRKLAALGAAVTVLSLALDPFFQQVVDFPERWVCDGNSSIPKVTRYEPVYDTVFTAGGLQSAQLDMDLQVVAQKFFYGNGTESIPFGNGTKAEIPVSCPTSNCTWPAQETLGICSSCADVSYLLEHACLTTRIDWISNLTGFGTESTYPNGTVCGYWLNATTDSPILVSGYNMEPVHSLAGNASAREALLARSLPLIAPYTRKPLYGGSIHYKNIRNPIVDVVIVGAANGSASVYRNQTPVAHECVLSWCIKTVRSSYFWASYDEEVVAIARNDTIGPYPWVVEKTSGGLFSTRYSENVTIDVVSDNRTSHYGLNNITAQRTIQLFDEIFPSWTTQAEGAKESLLRYRFATTPTLRTLEFNPWLPPNNISLHMKRLATALTNELRSSSSKEMVPGWAFSVENFVDVRWQWLSLPLGLLLSSAVFLLLTIMKTSREIKVSREQGTVGVGVWKTSAIATLLYGLPDEMQEKIKSSTSAGTPRAKAKELKVKLLPKGWRVSGNFLSPMTPRVRQNQPPPGWI